MSFGSAVLVRGSGGGEVLQRAVGETGARIQLQQTVLDAVYVDISSTGVLYQHYRMDNLVPVGLVISFTYIIIHVVSL